MLIVHLGPKEKVGVNRIEAGGDLIELLYDCSSVLSTMFRRLNEADPEAAAAFKTAMQALVAEDDSPT